MNSVSSSRPIAIWLLSGCFLIFCMVIIGGITRLTGSGLSITEWNVIMGAVPPLNDQEWQIAFEKYKQIPQFSQVNSYFSLEDFKFIFWWEFIHRLTGRLIGVVFIVPFLWFVIRKKLDRSMLKKALFLFALGGLQGFLGWFMVKSGLTERTSVSHIRLAIHFFTAFITYGFTLWFALPLIDQSQAEKKYPKLTNLAGWILGVLLVQLVYGAFVAGLHAGKMYNTFPLMNGKIIPEEVWVSSWGIKNILNNPAMVQLLHRFLAFTLVILVVRLFILSRRTVLKQSHQQPVNVLLGVVLLQFILGVITVLYQAPLFWSSVHQINAFVLFTTVILTIHRFSARAAS